MNDYLSKIFDLSAYTNPVQRVNAAFVYVTASLVIGLVSLYVLLIPSESNLTRTLLQDALAGDLVSIITLVSFYLVAGLTFFFTRKGNLTLAGWGVPIMWYGLSIIPIWLGSRNAYQPQVTVSLAIFIIACGLVNRTRGLQVGTAISIATLWLNFNADISDGIIVTLQLLGTGLFVYMYIRYAEVSRVEGAQKATEERLRMAEITAQIAGLTLNRTNISDVLKRGLELIQKQYPQFYHAQVFLLDDSGRNARLVSSTGEAGRALIQRQHSIGVGTQSVIGQATMRNNSVVARTNDSETIHKRNEFLPDTLVEVAFPLRVGSQVIGALDLQSKLDLKLEANDMFTYQSLTDSFALAIDNVRQFEAAETRIRENQHLAQQARQALAEVDHLNKRLMEQAWSEYLRQQEDEVGLAIDFEKNTVEEESQWTPTLSQAMEDDSLIQSDKQNNRVVAIPLKIRGQVIGAMEFELNEGDQLDANDLNLIQEVSERFGLAAENARLVEESQRVAQREALINEIGSRLQATNNIESTLTEAARSLSNVLGANRVSIKLNEPGGSSSSNGTNGSHS